MRQPGNKIPGERITNHFWQFHLVQHTLPSRIVMLSQIMLSSKFCSITRMRDGHEKEGRLTTYERIQHTNDSSTVQDLMPRLSKHLQCHNFCVHTLLHPRVHLIHQLSETKGSVLQIVMIYVKSLVESLSCKHIAWTIFIESVLSRDHCCAIIVAIVKKRSTLKRGD